MTNINNKVNISDLNRTFANFRPQTSANGSGSLPSNNISDYFINTEKGKNKKRKHLGLKIALTSGTGIFLAGIITALTSPKNLKKNYRRILKHLNSKAQKLSEKNNSTFFVKVYQKSSDVLSKLNGFGNFAPLKDRFTTNILEKLKLDKITTTTQKWFRGIAANTQVKRYNTASTFLNEMVDKASHIASVLEQNPEVMRKYALENQSLMKEIIPALKNVPEEKLSKAIDEKLPEITRQLSLWAKDVKDNFSKWSKAFNDENILNPKELTKAKELSADVIKKIDPKDITLTRETLIKKYMEDLPKEFDKRIENLKDLKNYNNTQELKENVSEAIKDFGKFLPEVILEPQKKKYNEYVYAFRNLITNSVEDNVKRVNDCLDDISILIDAKDKTTRSQIRNIKKILEEYKAPTVKIKENESITSVAKYKAREESAQQIKVELSKTIDRLKQIAQEKQEAFEILEKTHKNINSKDVLRAKNSADKAQEAVNLLENVVNSFDVEPGIVEKMSILSNAIRDFQPETGYGYKLYESFKTQRNLFKNKFNKAIDGEVNKYFDKISDIELGSPPNDIAGLFVPLGLSALAISKADSKDKKVSVGLTTGFPAVGGVATYIYGTIKQISGPQNLLFGILTGFALNQIGSFIDKKVKEFQAKKNQKA